MDENFLENAEELTRSMTERAIQACRNAVSEPPKDFDGNCGCGNSVPAARAALGYYRCIECQSSLEKRQRTQYR